MSEIHDLFSKLKTLNAHVVSSYIISFDHVYNTCITNVLEQQS